MTAGANRAALAPGDFVAPAGLLLAFAAAHIAARRFAPGADPALLPVTALLAGVGLAFVTRLDPTLAASQTVWLFVGVALLAATLIFVPSLERLARYKYTIMLTGLVLLLLPAIVGREINGAKLWLRVGGLSFQPSEIAKILLVLFLAAYLAEFREVLSVSTRKVLGLHLPAARHLGPLLLMWAVSLFVLVAEKDLGSSLLFFGVFLVMLTAATGRSAYAIVGTVLFAIGATAAFFLFEHVRTRVGIWIDPFADAAGKGYQLVQSLFALAAGGLIGVGPGRGMPTRIPFVVTDFIFSADRRGARPARRRGPHHLLPRVLPAGSGHRGAGTLRHGRADGHRPGGDHRTADVRHRRRRHAPHPAHRHHAALRELRRLLGGGELHPPRAADARGRRRAGRGFRARRHRPDRWSGPPGTRPPSQRRGVALFAAVSRARRSTSPTCRWSRPRR